MLRQFTHRRANVVYDTLIHILQPAIWHGTPDQGWNGVDNQAKVGCALLQGFFSALSVLDIRVRSVPFEDLPGFVAQRHGAEEEPAKFSIEAAQARFTLRGFPRD